MQCFSTFLIKFFFESHLKVESMKWNVLKSQTLWTLSNGISLPKLFWPTVRKNYSSDQEKTFEITLTIYSNSERSEQFLVTECFFNLFLEISQILKNRNWKKLQLGFRNLQEKLEMHFFHKSLVHIIFHKKTPNRLNCFLNRVS